MECMPPRSLRKFYLSVPVMRLLIAGVAILIGAWAQWHPVKTESVFADEWLRDRFVRWHAVAEAEPRIAVIDIDEASLAAVGPWPWPRSRLAELLENLLGHYGVKGVALDIVLPEPADRDGDTRLAMLSRHGPVVLAQAFDYVARPVPLRVGQLAGGRAADGMTGAVPAGGFIANHPGLAQARQAGNIGYVPDGDGAIRRLPLLTAFEGREYATLSLALLECCAGAAQGKSPGEGLRRIPYRRDWSAYTVIRASDILALRLPETALAGRLVLVGSSSLGLADRVATPLTPSTSGVMVHAALLTALLDERAGQAPAAWPGRWIAALFSLLAAGVAVYAFPRRSAFLNVAMLGSAALAWLALAYWISPHDAGFSATAPLASLLFLLAVAVPFDWRVSQKRSYRLLETLRHYVAPEVVNELLRSDLKDPLAPRQGSVTTLIADMEGYTRQVECLSMEGAAQLTRDFLDCLTRPVLAKHGTLDKYTGDGLVAFWGAPLPIEDHADLALEAAQEIVAAVRQLSQARQQAGHPPLRVRIGIESGTAMTGDFGTVFRSIYTAVGDSVNSASRLQELARDLPYDILVGAETAALAKRNRCEPLGETLLRGKANPTALYTLKSAASLP